MINHSFEHIGDHSPSGVGVVYRKNLGQYLVRGPLGDIPCALSSMIRKQLTYSAGGADHGKRKVRDVKPIEHIDPIAVGDEVRFIDARDGTGVIVEVLPRRTYLARQSAVPMPDAHAFEQVIVANVDQVLPVFAAANPDPSWHMLDRYLVACESRVLPAAIVINKIDLARDENDLLDERTAAAINEYRSVGYPVIAVSAVTGEGLPALKAALEGRVSVLVGKSGVGKSSLLNALQPGLGLKVNEVSRGDGRGRHTTSHMEMFALEFDGGGAIVDTPGTREFGLWNVDADTLEDCFPEFRPFLGRCRFKLGCRHDEEPGCAIRKAVSEGQISDRRYFSFIKLRADP